MTVVNGQSDYTGMKVMVTGADGMLGSNIVRELIERKCEVHCFIEKHKEGLTLQGLPVTIHRGDLSREDDLVPLFRECDYLIHTAGVTAMWPARSDLSKRVNFEAVKLLVRLSKEYNLKRFVHIGTATSFGHGPIDNPGNENSPYINGKFKLDYQDTKYHAQQYLISEFRENAFPVIVLNPTFMIGKYDSGTGSNKMVLFVYKGKVPGYSPGGKNYVDVRDVAVAAVNALSIGRLGECYITGNRNLSYKDAFRMIAESLDVKPPSLKLPKFLSVSYGAIMSAVAAVTRKAPPVTYKMAKIGCEDCYYNSEKAVKELHMPQSPVEDAVRASLDWFKEQGMV